MIVRILGIILFTLTSLLAVFTMNIGNCTMSVADELLVGVVLSVGYVIGIGLLIARPPGTLGWIALAPGLIAVAYQFVWAADFFISYHFQGMSVCAWKFGIPEYGFDGREPFFTALWLGMSVFCVVGIALVMVRGRRTA